MAKKIEEEEPTETKFDPSKPLDDEDEEAEVQRRHKMTRRLKFLEESSEKGKSKDKKKPFSW